MLPRLPRRSPAEHCSVVEGRLLAFGVSGKFWVKLLWEVVGDGLKLGPAFMWCEQAYS